MLCNNDKKDLPWHIADWTKTMVSFSYFSQLGQFSEIYTLVKQRIVVESFLLLFRIWSEPVAK